MGLFHYLRMPFGLPNTPATFQHLMSQLLAGKEWSFVFVYLDDLLVVSKSITEHVEHLGKVLKQLGRVKATKVQVCTATGGIPWPYLDF